MKKWLAIPLICVLSACSQGISGVYGDEMGVTRYTFQSGGELSIEVMGMRQEGSYTRDGDQLEIALPNGGVSLHFTINTDGSLTGPMGVRLHRKRD